MRAHVLGSLVILDVSHQPAGGEVLMRLRVTARCSSSTRGRAAAESSPQTQPGPLEFLEAGLERLLISGVDAGEQDAGAVEDLAARQAASRCSLSRPAILPSSKAFSILPLVRRSAARIWLRVCRPRGASSSPSPPSWSVSLASSSSRTWTLPNAALSRGRVASRPGSACGGGPLGPGR
jgi:hypothetical protein